MCVCECSHLCVVLGDERDRSSQLASTCDCFHSDAVAATAAALWRHRTGRLEAARQFEPRTERVCVFVSARVWIETGLSGRDTQPSCSHSGWELRKIPTERKKRKKKKKEKEVAAVSAEWNFKMENSSSNSRFRSAMFNHGESLQPTLHAGMLVYFLNRSSLQKLSRSCSVKLLPLLCF